MNDGGGDRRIGGQHSIGLQPLAKGSGWRWFSSGRREERVGLEVSEDGAVGKYPSVEQTRGLEGGLQARALGKGQRRTELAELPERCATTISPGIRVTGGGHGGWRRWAGLECGSLSDQDAALVGEGAVASSEIFARPSESRTFAADCVGEI